MLCHEKANIICTNFCPINERVNAQTLYIYGDMLVFNLLHIKHLGNHAHDGILVIAKASIKHTY